MGQPDSYTLFLRNDKEVRFVDYVTANAAILMNEIAWLENSKSDKARKLFQLFDEGKFGQAARYYNTNKF